MNPKRDSTLEDLKRMVADLRRELAERTTERDEAIAQRGSDQQRPKDPQPLLRRSAAHP